MGRMGPVACQDAGYRWFPCPGMVSFPAGELMHLVYKGPLEEEGTSGAKVAL